MLLKVSPDKKNAVLISDGFSASLINGGWVARLCFDQDELSNFLTIENPQVVETNYKIAQETIHSLGTGHLVSFSDGCPSDFLGNDKDSTLWHTIVFSTMQLRHPPMRLEDGTIDVKAIFDDELYVEYFNAFERYLPQIRKWDKGRSTQYKLAFGNAFNRFEVNLPVWINAISFREYDLRRSKSILLDYFNRRSQFDYEIGFDEFIDDRGREIMKFVYVDILGRKSLCRPLRQLLVLLLTSSVISDQYLWYFKNIVVADRLNADLNLTLVSDTLSGDTQSKSDAEFVLRHLIDPHYDSPFSFGRSPGKRESLGDIFADNLAGWLDNSLNNPLDDLSALLNTAKVKDRIAGWRIWNPDIAFPHTTSAWDYLRIMRNER